MKKIDVVFKDKELVYWEKMVENFKTDIEEAEKRLVFMKKVLEMCEAEVKNLKQP